MRVGRSQETRDLARRKNAWRSKAWYPGFRTAVIGGTMSLLKWGKPKENCSGENGHGVLDLRGLEHMREI